MYMKNILNIPDVKRRFLANRFGLLKDIIRTTLIRIPFQSVTLYGSVKFTEQGRPPPTVEHALRDAFRGVGGMCPHNNYFLKLQLESIGYKVKCVSGCFRRTGVPGSHFVIIVTTAPDRKSPEQEYIIDVGCGVPLHEPIPLNDLPYRGRAGGLNFRFEWIDKNNLRRVNENGDAFAGSQPESFLSPLDYTIELTPKTFPDFAPIFASVLRTRKANLPSQGIYCFRYLNITDTDFECVCVLGLELIRITKETRTSQVFTNFDDLRKAITEFFPMMDSTEVDRAIENYK